EPQLVEQGLHRLQVPDAQAAVGEPNGQPALIGAPGVRPDGATLLAQAEGQFPSLQVPEGDTRGGRLTGEPVPAGTDRGGGARERAVIPEREHTCPGGRIPDLADAPRGHEGQFPASWAEGQVPKAAQELEAAKRQLTATRQVQEVDTTELVDEGNQ